MADNYTELFDKRTVGPFQHMSIIRYPHITTALSSSAKYNVLSTEFHRLIRRISVTPNLLYSLGQLCYNLSKLGYDIAFLMSKLHQLFHRIGPRYLPGDPSIYISQVSHYLYAHYTRNGLIYYAQALLAAPLVARHFLLRRRGRRWWPYFGHTILLGHDQEFTLCTCQVFWVFFSHLSIPSIALLNVYLVVGSRNAHHLLGCCFHSSAFVCIFAAGRHPCVSLGFIYKYGSRQYISLIVWLVCRCHSFNRAVSWCFAFLISFCTAAPSPCILHRVGWSRDHCVHSFMCIVCLVCSLGGALADFACGFDHAGLWRRLRFEGASGGGPLLLQLS